MNALLESSGYQVHRKSSHGPGSPFSSVEFAEQRESRGRFLAVMLLATVRGTNSSQLELSYFCG